MDLDNTQIKLDLTKVIRHLDKLTCSNCPLVVGCDITEKDSGENYCDILNEMLTELK